MTTATEFQTKVDKTSINMDRIDQILNGSETTDVVIDGGQSIPSIRKLQDEITEKLINIGIGDTAAAQINAKLNRWQVSFLDPPVVDYVAQVVRYGRFIIGREGETYKNVTPSDYGLTSFDLPLAIPSYSDQHYVDVSLLKPAQTAVSPIKKVTQGAFVAADLDTVPLALSYSGNFQLLWGGDVVNAKSGRFRKGVIFNNGDPMYDQDNMWGGGARAVYLPTLASQATSGHTGVIYDPVSNEALCNVNGPECAERAGYCKVLFPSTGQVWMLVVDRATGIPSTVTHLDYNAAPGNLVLLGAMWDATPQFFFPIRNANEFIGPNLFPAGKTMDDPAVDVYGDPGAGASEAITAPELTARGFTKGRRSAVNGRVVLGLGTHGGAIPRNVAGTFAFFRFAVQTSIDNALPSAGLVYPWNSAGNTGTFPMPMERKLSARAAIYSGFIYIGFDDFDKFYLGIDMSGTGAYAVVTGVQFCVRPEKTFGIRFADYPSGTGGASFNAAYPPVMFLNRGRPMPFYPGNIVKDKRTDYKATTSLWAENAGAGRLPHEWQGTPQIIVDPSDLDNGVTGAIDFRLPGAPDRRYRLPLTYRVGPAAGGGAVRRVAILGDSITNRETPIRTAQILEAMGYTVTCVGTMQNSGGGTPQSPAYPGEGREAHEFADYIYEHTDVEQPVPIGGEAAYRAGDDEYKRNRNPFIRAATGADDPQYVFNGYTFDYRFYLNRFGLPDPTHVIINLSRNDVSQEDPVTTLAQVASGYRVMRDRIRQALPNAYIGFAKYGEATSNGALTDWDTDQWNIITKLLTLIRADVSAGDGKLFFLPSYAHMTQEGGGWPLNADFTDANSGMVTCSMADYVHPYSAVRQQNAEVYAAFVGACAP